MSSQIDFLTFKNFLNKNNILLFDSQLRIAHFRYNNLVGGSDNESSDGLLIKINQERPYLLSHFINSLVYSNFIKTKYILDSLQQ
jgi:hypothetical protein